MTPTPVTLQRVAAWFDAQGLNYDSDDERILTGFPGLGVTLFFDGDDDIWFRVLGHWMGTIPPHEAPAVAAFASQWNAEKVIPKVAYGDNEFDGVPEVTVSGEIVGLVENGFTDEQLAGFLDMALSGLTFFAEAAQEAFPAYAPQEEEGN